MKMIYGGVPVESIKVKHYELNTNSADVQPSDMQAGVTCFARGEKIVGTGKAFEFASYGQLSTNLSLFSPSIVNIVEIASLDYPVRLSVAVNEMQNLDFSIAQTIGYITIDNVDYPITAQVNDAVLTFACEKTIELQYFCGKDNYI